MFDEVRFLVKQEQYKDMLKEAERERLLRMAARGNEEKAGKREIAIKKQPARKPETGLVLQLRRLMSFLL